MLQFHCKLVSCSGASINNQTVFVPRVSGELLPSTRQHRVHYAGFFLSAEQEPLLATLIQFASSTAPSTRGINAVEGVTLARYKRNFPNDVADKSRKVPCKGQKMLKNMKLASEHQSDERSRLN